VRNSKIADMQIAMCEAGLVDRADERRDRLDQVDPRLSLCAVDGRN
jgi:hypothetical protein